MNPRRTLALVINPKSGSCEPESVVAALEAHGATVTQFELSECAAAATSGSDRMVVAGGDGSIGPAAAEAARARLEFAVIPAGTANDFARAAGIPLDIDEAAELAATGEHLKPVDLCHMGERPFVNVASTGLSVHAAKKAHGFKRMLGALAYPVGALRAGFSAPRIRCTIEIDGTEWFAGAAWQVLVANTGAFGGGTQLETSDESDARLDVTVIEAGSRLGLARRAFGMKTGRLAIQSGVHNARGTNVAVHMRKGLGYNVDGETVSAASVAHFTVEPRSIQLVTPLSNELRKP